MRARELHAASVVRRLPVALATALGFAFTLAASLAGCAGPEPAATPRAAAVPAGVAPLTVGSDLDNKPFAWVDEQGHAQGRDVEMMEAIGHLLHRPIAWKRMDFDALLPAVARGDVDVVCATLGITPERAETVDFSRPYFTTELAVVTRAAPGAPTTLAQLAGRTVAAGAGTTSERAVRRQLPGAHGSFESEAGASTAERLASGAIDAVVMDGPAADKLVASDPGALRRLRESLGAEHYALVVHKGDKALLSALDDVLQQLERAGSLARWNARFGLAGGAGGGAAGSGDPAGGR